MKAKIKTATLWFFKSLANLTIQIFLYARARPKLSSILFLVIIWHIAVYQLFGIKLPKLSKVVGPPKQLTVQTVKLRPPPKPKAKVKSAPVAKKMEKKKQIPEKKKETPKPKKEKEPVPKPPSHESQALLEELSKTLQKITDRNEKDFKVPKIQTIAPISPEKESPSAEISFEFNAADPADLWYREELIKRLKLYLKLPDIENIHVRLVINKSGSVSKIIIVESKSKKNENYVLKTIPTIPFPKFGSQMSKYEYRIFPLILESEG